MPWQTLPENINKRKVIIMLEEIIKAADKKANEELTLSKGIALAVAPGAFVLGFIFGSACGKKKVRRKLAKASEDDFDAEEYVKSLNFDEEE